MPNFAVMRLAKLKGAKVAASDKHTERQQETPNADPQLTPDNIHLRGHSDMNLAQVIKAKITQARATNNETRKQRKDAVTCVEFLMTATRGHFEKDSAEQADDKLPQIDPLKELAFFEKTEEFMQRLEQRGWVFVKAVAHRDETTPHVAAYAIPFTPAGKLNCKYHLNGKQQLSALQDEFAQVMAPIGLARGIKGSKATHQEVERYYGKVEMLDEAILEKELAVALAGTANRQWQMVSDQAAAQDIPLADILRRFTQTTPERVFETHNALVLLQPDSTKITAIVTNNQAYTGDGAPLSAGSSLQLLTKLTQKPTTALAQQIDNIYGLETAQHALHNQAYEISRELQTPSPYLDHKSLSSIQAEVARQLAPVPPPEQTPTETTRITRTLQTGAIDR